MRPKRSPWPSDSRRAFLYFRATFLVLGSANSGGRKYNDVGRFEKLANIIKQFKLGCTCVLLPPVASVAYALYHSKCVKGSFTGLEVKNSNFTALISPLTPNTFVLVVTDSSIRTFAHVVIRDD